MFGPVRIPGPASANPRRFRGVTAKSNGRAKSEYCVATCDYEISCTHGGGSADSPSELPGWQNPRCGCHSVVAPVCYGYRLVLTQICAEQQVIPSPICPYCGHELTDVNHVGSAIRRAEPHPHFYSSECESCGLRFTCSVTGDETSEWQSTSVGTQQLTAQLDEDSIDQVSSRLSQDRYPRFAENWRSFLARCRPSDELWRWQDDKDATGVALVRNGLPVADFRIPAFNLFKG